MPLLWNTGKRRVERAGGVGKVVHPNRVQQVCRDWRAAARGGASPTCPPTWPCDVTIGLQLPTPTCHRTPTLCQGQSIVQCHFGLQSIRLPDLNLCEGTQRNHLNCSFHRTSYRYFNINIWRIIKEILLCFKKIKPIFLCGLLRHNMTKKKKTH